jgi:gamma-glutamyltranspeptidase/glutathione hydrolase
MNRAIQERGYNFLLEEPEWAEDFAPNGKLVKEGDIMTRKRYAKTLQTIADEGASVFYKGSMGKCPLLLPMSTLMISPSPRHTHTFFLLPSQVHGRNSP